MTDLPATILEDLAAKWSDLDGVFVITQTKPDAEGTQSINTQYSGDAFYDQIIYATIKLGRNLLRNNPQFMWEAGKAKEAQIGAYVSHSWREIEVHRRNHDDFGYIAGVKAYRMHQHYKSFGLGACAGAALITLVNYLF